MNEWIVLALFLFTLVLMLLGDTSDNVGSNRHQ